MKIIQGFRRTTLYTLIALLALAMSGVACGGEEEAPLPTGVKTGGTLKVGMVSDYISFDPPVLVAIPDQVTVIHTYDTLVYRHSDLTMTPSLAESWTFNSDASRWTFKLREGVYFNTWENGEIVRGKEFMAEDVIFSINRMFEMESPTASTVSPKVPNMEAVDDYTVIMDFGEPNATLLDGLVKYHAHITPSDIDPARFQAETFGTGPFLMTDHVVGERTTFVKNPDYFKPNVPLIDELVYIFIPSPETRAQALIAGTIDMIYDLDTTSIPALQADPNTDVQIAVSGGYMNLAMNTTEPPFDNLGVRKAIQAATDRNAVFQAAQLGYGGIAYDHPITPNDPVFDESCKPPDYDPVLAKRLLSEAGYPDGIDLTLHTSTAGASMVDMATVLKESFKPAGINLEIIVMPEDGYWSDGWMVKPFVTVWWGGRPPYEAFNVVYRSGGSWNEASYVNDKVDALLNEAKATGSLEEQKRIYSELQCLIVDEVPRIIPVFRPVSLGIRNDVRDSWPMWDATMSLHNVWLDR